MAKNPASSSLRYQYDWPSGQETGFLYRRSSDPGQKLDLNRKPSQAAAAMSGYRQLEA
jgi:hypothetical protein